MAITKNDDLLFIERCFSSIKAGVAIDENLIKIERAVNRLFDLKVHVSIIDNKTNTFFGMNVYPSLSVLDKMSEAILSQKSSTDKILDIWAKSEEWYIEIDSILLSDMGINANPAEITAVLLHEIGHVVYTNTIPARINNIFRYQIMSLNYRLRKLISDDKIRKLFHIAITESCGIKNYSLKAEKDADKFTIHYGYGEDLKSFITKLLTVNGNELIDRSVSDENREIRVIVNWTITNIKELELRKKELRHALKIEMLKTPSIYTKKIIQDIFHSFYGDTNERYRVLLAEQYMSNPIDKISELEADQYLSKHVARVLQEASGNIFDKQGRLKKITQADIDVLTVEAERIDNTNDKIYLLDKLYSQYEMVLMGIDYIESGDKRLGSKVAQSKQTLESMKKQLERLRDQIINTKIIEKSYGVFYRVPRGYEG